MYVFDANELDWVPVSGGTGVGTEVEVLNVVTIASADLTSLAAEDFATQATLALIKAKTDNIDVALSTRTKPADIQKVDGSAVIQPVSAATLPLPTGAAQESGGNLAALVAKDFATQTTLAAVLAKILAAPATEAKQDTGNTSLATIAAKDFATQTTLAAILSKILAAPATEAKQDTGNTSLATIAGKDFATQATLAAILAELGFKTEPTDTQIVKEYHPGATAITLPDYKTISDTTRNLQLAAANVARRSLRIVNPNSISIPLSEGGVASPSNYTKLLAPQEEWEVPYPACTVALNAFLREIPDNQLVVAERS